MLFFYAPTHNWYIQGFFWWVAIHRVVALCAAIDQSQWDHGIAFYVHVHDPKVGCDTISLFAGGIFFIFLGYLKNYQLICLFSFLLSTINEAFRPANMAAIGSYSDETNRTRSSSLVRLSVNLGWAVGASIGGWIAAHNYQYLFWVDGTTNLVAAGFAMIFLPKGTEEGKRQKKSDETGLVNSVWKDSDYLIFVLLKFLYAIRRTSNWLGDGTQRTIDSYI